MMAATIMIGGEEQEQCSPNGLRQKRGRRAAPPWSSTDAAQNPAPRFTSSSGGVWPTSRIVCAMCFAILTDSGVMELGKKVTAVPEAPARPVRPILWM